MKDDHRVLITGAGGFIGGRVAEALHGLQIATVRAGVRRWASAARIGRLPIEIEQCDVTDAKQVEAALKDVRSVVHCVTGTPDVIIRGTRTLLEAALRLGVERVVHLSTIDVYGHVSGTIDETFPYQSTGKPYGDSKIEAENICWEFYERGLPICILRPTIVYGPFSKLWTVEFAQRLQCGSWFLPEQSCKGICNLVFIDDLVSAILLALCKDQAIGEAFNVNGSEQPTWHGYFCALNDAMGLSELTPESVAVSRLSALMMTPVRKSAKFLLTHFQDQIMSVYRRYDFVKAAMRRAETVIKNAPTNAEFSLYSRNVVYSIVKARRTLGYEPIFTMNEGIQLSVAWLEHHGFHVPGRRLLI